MRRPASAPGAPQIAKGRQAADGTAACRPPSLPLRSAERFRVSSVGECYRHPISDFHMSEPKAMTCEFGAARI